VIFGVLGGLMHGGAQEDWREPWENAVSYVRPYAVGISFTLALLMFSNLFFFIHLGFMWLRLGRRSSHPTLLASPHDGGSPHGPEGDADNVGPTAAAES